MEYEDKSNGFETDPGFCPDCGSILPLLGDEGGVTCYACKREWPSDGITKKLKFNLIPVKNNTLIYFFYFLIKFLFILSVFGDMSMTYTINFNSIDTYINEKKDRNNDEAEGPVVERKCAKCGNDKMSYATLQLRSADEGQTVFFTCTKCKYVSIIIITIIYPIFVLFFYFFIITKNFYKYNVLFLFFNFLTFRFKETENS